MELPNRGAAAAAMRTFRGDDAAATRTFRGDAAAATRTREGAACRRWKDRDDRRGGGRDDRGGRDGYYERDRRPPPEGRIFVSGLPEDIKERELDDLYYRYGRIDYIEIKRGGRRLEAVICYFDRRDASYAQRETDGMRFERDTLRVDLER